MRNKILTVVKDMLRECLEPTKDIIKNLIKVNFVLHLWLQIELAYINTNHPDFLRNSALAEIYNTTGVTQRNECQTPYINSNNQMMKTDMVG